MGQNSNKTLLSRYIVWVTARHHIVLDMNRQSTRVVITTLAWLSLGIMSPPAQANLVRYEFTVEILPDPTLNKPLLGSRGNGFFIFDDSLTPYVAYDGVSHYSVSEVRFDFLGRTYTENDDVGFNLCPEISCPSVEFENNVFLGLNYFVDSPSPTEAGFFFHGVEQPVIRDNFTAGRGAKTERSSTNPTSGGSIGTGFGGDRGLSSGRVTYTLVSNNPEPQPVPETTSVFGLLTLSTMSSFALRHNSKRRMKQPTKKK